MEKDSDDSGSNSKVTDDGKSRQPEEGNKSTPNESAKNEAGEDSGSQDIKSGIPDDNPKLPKNDQNIQQGMDVVKIFNLFI